MSRHQFVRPWQTAPIAHRVHRLRHTTRLQARDSTRVLRRRAPTLGVLHRQLGVEAQLFFEIRIAPLGTQRADETMNPLAEERHGGSVQASPRSSACMIVVMRSQACFSRASSRRPAAVST